MGFAKRVRAALPVSDKNLSPDPLADTAAFLEESDRQAKWAYESVAGSTASTDDLAKATKAINDIRWDIGVQVAAAQAAQAATAPEQKPDSLLKGAAACRDLAELKAMVRCSEVTSLNTAGKALAGITVVLAGVLTTLGFAGGDFLRMYRDHPRLSVAFLAMAALAVLLGTFAVAVDGGASRKNLRWERVAVYSGVALAGTAFVMASALLALGEGHDPARPTLSASVASDANSSVLTVMVTSAALPESYRVELLAWGEQGGSWHLLLHNVAGPDRDGAVSDKSQTSYGLGQYTALSIVAGDVSQTPLETTDPPAACALPEHPSVPATRLGANASCEEVAGGDGTQTG